MRSMVVMILLVFLELGLTFLFVGAILKGNGDDLLLGTILGAQFLVLALVMVCYMGSRLSPREVVEDRDEGLLW